ncbi:amidase [Methylocaldum szegediense]|uniref:Asp-tRNA(Asn)/Glu-tRNA(Gln) amidotransferase A subunit family amidase n=1 Tax=Methylocaldum szegediense TaxID=73780 RepID=A0ABN8X116_9GAMM|nr:amidase [Methylocaldum szegediense]CAI8806192.1 Asp-tRNA(Asn)/Glu-tRNA(Gln) amidotransferase A subunit family amidase [Methylocaldum szegediense]
MNSSTLVAKLRSDERPLLDHIQELQNRFAELEPTVLAFVAEEDRWTRIQREAENLLRRYPKPAGRPPLFGVPVGIKDIFRVEGFETRAGSRLPPEEIRGAEASSVKRLKEAGALIIGKTVTAEFAYLAPGPTRNPHDPEHTPGGSSSGSAAAVAARLCLLALGTQTVGSINRPAAFCGICGFKPSYGRLPADGVIPLAPGADHIGWFAPDVDGIELAAKVLIPDWRSSLTETRPKLGVPAGPYLDRVTPDARDHFQQTCALLQAAGYILIDVPAFPDFEELYRWHHCLVAAEAAQVHANWYRHYKPLYRPETVELIERGLKVSATDLATARAVRQRQRERLTALMRQYQVHAWVSPSATGPAPHGLSSTGDSVMQLPWTQAGVPLLTVPTGFIGGLPVGIQIAGSWGADETLVRWGRGIESSLACPSTSHLEGGFPPVA